MGGFLGPQNPETKAQTNLIVNYLPPTLTEIDIRNLFGEVGPVKSCKLIKDKLTNISLGYAFINYDNTEDAKKAIDSLNGLPLQNKTIKVSYARPSSATIKNANLYIAYLPKTYTQIELEDTFRQFGKIITSKILIDNTTGLSRGVGFVRYDKHTEAESAMSALNGKHLPGCTQPILVKFANQPKSAGKEMPEIPVPSISGISAAISRRANVFNSSGAGGPMRLSLMQAMRYNPVGASHTPSTIAATTAATPIAPHQPFCVFVYNIPEHTADSLLYQLFSPFGAIESVRVVKDSATQKCKRYGFVNMKSYDEAYTAILALNGFELEGRHLQVSFKVPKD